MKKWLIEYETDYCDDFPEIRGEIAIKADSEEEAVKKFHALKIPKAIIFNVHEERN